MSALEAYLNDPAVRRALHVSPNASVWRPCAENLAWTHDGVGLSTLYSKLVAAQPSLRVLVYSGDVDSCVPFTTTHKGVDELGLPHHSPYQPWYHLCVISTQTEILTWLRFPYSFESWDA
eukprot:COSAG01_NODE_2584_length_7418_cov_4.468643_2_plen_120_part_00